MDIKQNVLLSTLTTFKIGGVAKYLVEAKDEKDLGEAFEFAQKNSLRTIVLGGGSNILVSDSGFDGLVILMKGGQLEVDGETITVGAGVALAELVRFASDNNLVGMEWAVGIPGTVGGAIRGNAGAYGSDIGSAIDLVDLLIVDSLGDISTGNQNAKIKMQNEGVKTFEKNDCEFAYRTSVFKRNPNLVIISAKLKLQKGDGGEIKEKMNKIIQERTGKIVKGLSAGSFFVNPVVTDEKLRREFALDTGSEPKGETLPAGWLVESAGLRGKKVGGAMVSEQHGNFIINIGNATAEEVVMLASIIKQKVRIKYGIQLREEIVYIGF